ncbi:hypothetical protein [Methanococcoides alaskense]|nr:hypothetical protein [Methanococcoides alaskense]MDA0525213.1 hypothetical protein [Methanococcoides alaskense]
MIVISTVMLNNIIYASNMASESSNDINHFEISNIAQITQDASNAAYYNATTGNQFENDVYFNYLETYSQEISTLYAHRGFSLSLGNGTLNDAYFTKNGLITGRSNWTIIDNIDQTNKFTIEMEDTSKLSNSSDPFEIHAINQSGVPIWKMKLYDDGSNINVSVDDQTYPIGASNNSINLSIIYNDPVFHFATSTTGETYRIDYFNSSNAMGLYSITGTLADGRDFTRERYKVINTTISIASSKNSINVSLPITVP